MMKLEGKNPAFFYKNIVSLVCMIRKLASETSELIKSQQYINNTYTITKELLENSLDSGATIIKIIINEDLIRVEDNGSGIIDLSEVGNPGYTSKEITTYYVLGLNTDDSNIFCGYRGLALSSIKNMCNLEIISKHVSSHLAYKKTFFDNKIVSCARENGTTINVSKIFENCPLRRSLNLKNISKDITKISSLLESYSMVYKITFLFKYKGKTIYNQKGYNSLIEYCKDRFKNQFDNSLCKNTNNFFLFVSPMSESKDSSKIFYRKRYVVSKKITKEIKKTFNLYQDKYPLFFLELKGILDFNISPDKSEILFDNEKEIIKEIKETILNYFSEQIYLSTKNNDQEIKSEFILDKSQRPSLFEKSEINHNTEEDSNFQNLIDEYVDDAIFTKQSVSDTFKKNLEKEIVDQSNYISDNEDMTISLVKNEKSSKILDQINLIKNNIVDEKSEKINYSEAKDKLHQETINVTLTEKCIKKREIDNEKILLVNSPIFKKFCSTKNFDLKDFNVKDTEVIDISDDNFKLPHRQSFLESPVSDFKTPLKLVDTVFDYIKTSQIPKISLTILKSDFCHMKVIGQFNKGFILTTLEKDNKKYLLIIDQHASDEIYNYENLKNNTKIVKQKLVIPYEIDLSPIDSLFVQENKDLFNKYGFEIKNNMLMTIPIFKGEEFDIKDFRDLLEKIKSDQEGLDKIHRILATKACRMSVMIGEHLQKSRLEKIVKNLSTLERPWKCPHGRPTFMIIEEIY